MKKTEIKRKIKAKIFELLYQETADVLKAEINNQREEIRNLKNRLLEMAYSNQHLQNQINRIKN